MDVNYLLYNGFETLDLFGPVEILSRVDNLRSAYYSISGGIIESTQGTQILTESIGKADMRGVLVIPGGRGTRTLINDEQFINQLSTYAKEAKYCLSVCTGAALLAKAGVLNWKKATSNKKALEWVESTSHKTSWKKCARWVKDGNIYTSSGVSAGMDMALGFVSDICGKEKALQIADDIEYIWNKDMENDWFAV